MFPSVWPTLGIVAWAINGMDHANALGNTMVAPRCDPSVMTATISTYVGGVTIGCIMPTTVGAMSMVGSPVCPAVGSGIAAITGCSMMSEGDP